MILQCTRVALFGGLLIKPRPSCRNLIETGSIEILHDACLRAEAAVNIDVPRLDARCEVGSRGERFGEFHLDPASIDFF
jgi:hypothetical protein